VHIPEALADVLDLREGGKMNLWIEEDKLILEPIRVRDALELAIKGKKFASVSFDEVKKMSLEEQDR
jgi:antitoxin MazE